MARTNDISIDFISCTQLVEKIACSIDYISCTVETVIPSNINFFGASVDGKFEDVILFYQVY